MAVAGKGILAAGSALSRKASSALVKRAAKRKAERLAKEKVKKNAERAAKRAATRAKEIKAAQDKAGRAKRNRSKVTSSKPKTSGKTKKLTPREERGLGSNRAISLARKIGKTNTITRKISRYPKKIVKNKFVQMSAISGVSAYGGAKAAGGSSSNTVSNKSSYTQADYDEARRRIYGR